MAGCPWCDLGISLRSQGTATTSTVSQSYSGAFSRAESSQQAHCHSPLHPSSTQQRSLQCPPATWSAEPAAAPLPYSSRCFAWRRRHSCPSLGTTSSREACWTAGRPRRSRREVSLWALLMMMTGFDAAGAPVWSKGRS